MGEPEVLNKVSPFFRATVKVNGLAVYVKSSKESSDAVEPDAFGRASTDSGT